MNFIMNKLQQKIAGFVVHAVVSAVNLPLPFMFFMEVHVVCISF